MYYNKDKETDFVNGEVLDEKEQEAEIGITNDNLYYKELNDNKKEECDDKQCFKSKDKQKTTVSNSKKLLDHKRQSYNKLSYYLISFYAGLCSITELAVAYHFKDVLKIEPAQLSQITSFIVLPWSLKPLLGLLTDFCPIFGYKRKIYLILCGFLSMFCWFSMASYEPNLSLSILCLLFINISNAFCSVLGEAIVVELARDKTTLSDGEENNNNNDVNTSHRSQQNADSDYNNRAKDYVSLFMIFKYAGVLFASFAKGSLVETIGIRGVFSVGMFLPNLVIIAGLMMVDYKVKTNIGARALRIPNNDDIDDENNHNTVRNNYLTISETGGVDTNHVLHHNEQLHHTSNISNHEVNETPSFKDMIKFVCQANILLPIMFIVLFMSTPSYSDPFFYFLTNTLNFSASSLGKISFCSTIGVLIGILVYKQYFKEAQFRSVIITCTIISFVFSFSGWILVKRYNLEFGVNDFWLVLLSNSLLSMIGEIMLLPLLSMACVLCPKNMEGTIFSVFMSALNFGGTLSGLFGSIITTYLGITSSNYDNLPCLILISNIATLLPLPILFCLNEKYFKH